VIVTTRFQLGIRIWLSPVDAHARAKSEHDSPPISLTGTGPPSIRRTAYGVWNYFNGRRNSLRGEADAWLRAARRRRGWTTMQHQLDDEEAAIWREPDALNR
jgi:hypothetical protein